jgi:serine O-acetyltransferase
MPKESSDADPLIAKLVASYRAHPHTHHFDSDFLPSRAKTIQALELLRKLMFPGFFDEKKLTAANVSTHVESILDELRALLYDQIRQALRYAETKANGKAKAAQCEHCDEEARRVTDAFLAQLPEIRRLLGTDVQAAYDGDPAAGNTDEIIFCYPGLDAIFTHRVAHELFKLHVPLLPRIMAEYAHNETGIDIHPGAQIDESFFIDHGTGVVIGETCIIGKRVRIYQGVTLGALTTKMVEALRGRKRHPTIEDEVTIYANATILGGQTVVGKAATINGGVFLVQSVPAGNTVSAEPPRLNIKSKRSKGEAPPDFQV